MNRAEWRQTVSQRLQPLLDYWKALAPREQRVVAGGVLLLALLSGWLFAVQPAVQRIDHWQQELPKLRSQAATLDDLLKGIDTPPGDGDPALAVSHSLDAGGLQAHYQLQSPTVEGEGWQVEFTDAPAAAVLEWLQNAAPRLPLVITRLHLQRIEPDGEPPEPDGKVAGQLLLERATDKESS